MGEIINLHDNTVTNEAIENMLKDLFITAQATEIYQDAQNKLNKELLLLGIKETETYPLTGAIIDFAKIGMILGFQFALVDHNN